jgi:hypothetical protein
MADTPRAGTPVAQDDVLGEAARATGPVEGADARAFERKDRDKGEAGEVRLERGDAAEDGSAAPGRDENQAGFVKDADKKFSP